MIAYWLFWSIFVAEYLSPCSVSAQAPGDENDFCLEISTAPAYASTVKPLLDSWQYQSLLGPGGVWRSLSFDNDDNGWVSIPSSICQEIVTVNEPLSKPQDNWLFTQHISKSMNPSDSYPVNIFVNVSYIFETDCDVPCNPFVHLGYYLSNDIDSEGSMDPSQYTKLSALTSSNVEPFPMIQFSTSSFSIAPENNGFYLALNDSGANVTIFRILVYRFIGPMKQIGLTLLPETPAPISELINVDGICVANSNTTSGGLPALTLSRTGNWTSVEPCVCIEGHYLKEIEDVPACVACSPGEYKDSQGNDNCLPCPDNSQSLENGAAACTCLPSFYRSPSEGPEIKCTGPPSFPRQILITNVTHTSADISWQPPDNLGGRSDLYYNISYSLNSIWIYPEQNPIHVTHYKLEELIPCSLYFVLIIAENGVSSQAGGQSQRSVGGFLLTTEGTPKVTNVEVLEGVVVDWTPLTDGCVVISEYHVQFRVEDEPGGSSFITVPNSKAVYDVNVTADLPLTGQPIYVVVRANSSETGVGEWSDPVLFAEVNPNSPEMPPTANPTSSKVIGSTSSSSSSSTSTGTMASETGTTIPTTSPTSPTNDKSILTIVLGVLFAITVITLAIIGIVAISYVCYKRHRRKDTTDFVLMKVNTGALEFRGDESEVIAEEPDDATEPDDTKPLV